MRETRYTSKGDKVTVIEDKICNTNVYTVIINNEIIVDKKQKHIAILILKPLLKTNKN